jgi:hypothetical protein
MTDLLGPLNTVIKARELAYRVLCFRTRLCLWDVPTLRLPILSVVATWQGDQDVDGRIILRWIFRKLEGVMGTGWSWLRIGTGGGHLWVK